MTKTRSTSLVPTCCALLGIALGAALIGAAPGPAAGPHEQDAVNHYIGAAKCKTCHKSEETGNQYGAWEAMKHAKAFETLASPEAKKLGAEKGIADPQKAPECLRCHVTAYGQPEDHIKKGFDPKLGVQCETCHGPGEQHMKARMVAAAKGAPPGQYVEIPAGEIVSNPPAETCRECHNAESPSFQPFCYHARVVTLRHLNPKKPRTEEQKAAVLVCGCGESCACAHECADGCGVPAKK